VIKSISMMGGPCGTHDKDEKSETANLATVQDWIWLSRLRNTALQNVRTIRRTTQRPAIQDLNRQW